MNKIKKFFLKRKKEEEFREFIHDHKINILRAFYEMINCKEIENIIYEPEILFKLWFRALEHDDSKYCEGEFDAYRAHQFPIDIQEKRLNELYYLKARDHHITTNRHHWQARINDSNEELTIEQKVDCLENIIDWMAVGYALNDRPYQYYESIKDEISLPDKQREFMEKIIYEGVDKKYV